MHVEFESTFNSVIREFVISLILIIGLHFVAYLLLSKYKKKHSFYEWDQEDALVYRITLWICTTSLATSIGAALLLPISVISNEVLLLYPESSYIEWLTGSLIYGLWNLAFLFSNLSLFVLLPFAYFFFESQGFSGSRMCSQGIKARIYETFAVLALVGSIFLGMIYIVSAIFNYEHTVPLSDVWGYYLPFSYSCVSFLGALMLLVCTPVGFSRLFTVVDRLIMTPQIYTDMLGYGVMHEATGTSAVYTVDQNQPKTSAHGNKDFSLHEKKTASMLGMMSLNFLPTDNIGDDESSSENNFGQMIDMSSLKINVYLIAMFSLFVFTLLAVVMVILNTGALCFGTKTLPMYTQKLSLGISSSSAMGFLGDFLEVILILYLCCSSVVGLYALPVFCHLRPKLGGTSIVHIIANCVVLLILSSALPVLARILGITNFDLLGDFGKIHWLENFYIVLFYNVAFTVASALCLSIRMTALRDLTSRLICFTKMKLYYKRTTLFPGKDLFSQKTK